MPRRVGDGILALITQLNKWYDSEVHLVNAPAELSTHQVTLSFIFAWNLTIAAIDVAATPDAS